MTLGGGKKWTKDVNFIDNNPLVKVWFVHVKRDPLNHHFISKKYKCAVCC